jgi:hypothetical protein
MKINPALETPFALGFFEILSGFVDVSDPCYDQGTSCRAAKIPTQNGTYIATVLKENYGEEGERCKVLEATLEDNKGKWVRTEYDIGVDSGQAGIFDSKYYGVDEIGRKWKLANTKQNRGICEDAHWYSMCCDITGADDGAGVVPYGVVSSSGWGDGGYNLWVRMDEGLATGFRIIFIDAEQEGLEE